MPQHPRQWTEAEKTAGAATGEPAGEAGAAVPKGLPSDDRAATEAAAANTEPTPAEPGAPRKPA